MGIVYIILPNLQVILFFVYLIVENFEIIFICYLTMGNILVYSIIIILNILNKVADCIELGIVKVWSL